MVHRKLTWDQVTEIRTKYAGAYPHTVIAKMFGVHVSTIRKIISGRYYKEPEYINHWNRDYQEGSKIFNEKYKRQQELINKKKRG